ncbi:hypothetical protein N7530_008330 [Penicillium desertorum]|uniref:Uncharacterized protein n=1 Tax=Penicillium desertorum TaxID=1303715 RepID=A0A9W9WPH7_9EURO|nr:hypothetical protein N7530_008330 [Penicillium desertorum]
MGGHRWRPPYRLVIAPYYTPTYGLRSRPHQTIITTIITNPHHQPSLSTLTINTHRQPSLSTLTIDPHRQPSPSTLTLSLILNYSSITLNTRHPRYL